MASFRRLALPLLAIPALLACSGGDEATDRPMAGAITLNDLFTGEFDLVDQDGQPAPDERFEGKPALVYFGFTSCPDICPAALGNLTATLDRLGEDAGEIQALFITVDPERDTPERLAEHLSYDPRILGLTGSEEALSRARAGFKAYAARREMPDSAMGYTVDHQRLFYLLDASGQPVVAFNDGLPPEQIEAIVRRTLGI